MRLRYARSKQQDCITNLLILTIVDDNAFCCIKYANQHLMVYRNDAFDQLESSRLDEHNLMYTSRQSAGISKIVHVVYISVE